MVPVFHQAAFSLPVRSLTGRDDFFVSPENEAAVALINSFPSDFFGAVIFGEKGCGKTHLAHLFCETVFQKTGKKADIISFSCWKAEFDPQTPYIVLEDVGAVVDEAALFHFLNQVKSLNGFVLMTSETAPSAFPIPTSSSASMTEQQD